MDPLLSVIIVFDEVFFVFSDILFVEILSKKSMDCFPSIRYIIVDLSTEKLGVGISFKISSIGFINYTEKESPHPQDDFAFGFINSKPYPLSPSE